jgi:cell division protein FtsN
MRRVRSDVSHRIRRRPSIFSTRWFRIAFGVGVLLVVALLVGPSVASWFGGDLPRSLSSFVPWGGSTKTVQSARTPDPVTATRRPAAPAPSTSSSGSARGAAGTSGTAVPPSIGPSSESPPTTAPRVGGTARSAPAAVPPPATTAPASPARDPAPPRVAAATPAPGALAAPPAVYWVQVGAFLDHKNADRLVEKLKGEGLSAATTSFEQSRVLYRVILVGGDGGRVSEDAIERAKGLGHPVEATPDGPAVTGLVPLRKAVETSHSLRQQGVPVRLKQEVSSSTFRVVRVGSFTTAAEADAALAQLSAKGVEGVVVREQR